MNWDGVYEIVGLCTVHIVYLDSFLGMLGSRTLALGLLRLRASRRVCRQEFVNY